MKPIKSLLRNTFLFRGECAYTIKEALTILINEHKNKMISA